MDEHGGLRVDVLGAADVSDVVSVLGEAFADYPVMRFVLGPGGDYPDRLATLIRLFVTARILRGEIVLGIGEGGHRRAAALVSFSDRPAAPAALATLRQETWATLGADARVRYEAFAAAAAPFAVQTPHLYLNMVGVRPAQAGRGLGRALLASVHARAVDEPGFEGVALTTENPANVALYEHFGYTVLGRGAVTPALASWAMYRPNARQC